MTFFCEIGVLKASVAYAGFSFKGGADGTISWPFSSSMIAIGACTSEDECGCGAFIQHRLLSEPVALPIAIKRDRCLWFNR